MEGPGRILSRRITQLGILSFDIKQNFRVMNQSLTLKLITRFHLRVIVFLELLNKLAFQSVSV